MGESGRQKGFMLPAEQGSVHHHLYEQPPKSEGRKKFHVDVLLPS